jgi:phage terminase large subunit-like protein
MRREDSRWWAAGYTAEWWKTLDKAHRAAFLDALSARELEEFAKDWRIWARDKQLPPDGDWHTWLILAGRGFGKSRTGSEWVRDLVENRGVGRVCLLGQGEDDVREVMIEGESGILACSPSWMRPKFYPSVGCGHLEWPNGAVGFVYSAADPEALRGPQFEAAWVDEPMAFPPEARTKAISNMEFGLRLGTNPQLLYTTTPRPHRWLKKILEDAKKDEGIMITRGSTFENSDNLAKKYLKKVRDAYEGTSLGKQELYAEVLGDEDGALFLSETLDKHRIRTPAGADPEQFARDFARSCDRVVVGVDPNMTATGTAHAAGIVVCARKGEKRFVLADRSVKGGPEKWARAAVQAFIDYQADEIVAEVNQGGDMVRMVIEQVGAGAGVDVKVVKVRATRGKQRRAEPVAAAYEQGKVSHVGEVGHDQAPGRFYELERQMTALHDGYDPTGEDFDRADAAVWGLTRLSKKGGSGSSGAVSGIYTFDDFGAEE